MSQRQVTARPEVDDVLAEVCLKQRTGEWPREKCDAVLWWFRQFEERLADRSNAFNTFGIPIGYAVWPPRAWVGGGERRRQFNDVIVPFCFIEIILEFDPLDDVRILHVEFNA